jgi:hypothetical protein
MVPAWVGAILPAPPRHDTGRELGRRVVQRHHVHPVPMHRRDQLLAQPQRLSPASSESKYPRTASATPPASRRSHSFVATTMMVTMLATICAMGKRSTAHGACSEHRAEKMAANC